MQKLKILTLQIFSNGMITTRCDTLGLKIQDKKLVWKPRAINDEAASMILMVQT